MAVSSVETGGKVQLPDGWKRSGKDPVLIWDYNNQRIYSIRGNLRIVGSQIRFLSQRLGSNDTTLKIYDVYEDGIVSYKTQSGINKQRSKIRLIRNDSRFRGGVAYFFGVQGGLTARLGLEGHLL
ncbi:hypothetical protein D5018_05435 [Parashewanella curva]|uniref:Uncharacterized protein n=1 Tax=Parashewanella curva TaxID=2338552 RepID=A0A3L8PZ18_9GAMM|nr:hypothetical protein [Parashewanella curva]RLV60716.1 hypothetical protein D5018_05435 [Parashewanella curva]